MNHALRIMLVLLAGLAVGGAAGWLLIPAEVRLAPPPAVQTVTPESAAIVADPASEAADAPTATVAVRAVQGVARFADGSPCAGLPLVATPVQTRHYSSVDLQYVTPEARLEQNRGVIHNLRQNARRAITAADGSFEISGLSAGEHTLYSDDRARPLVKRPWPCKAGDELALEVCRALFVQLDIQREDGKPLATARMSLTDPAGKYHPTSYWSPGLQYEVTAGKWRVRAYGEPRDLFSADVELEVPPGGLDKPAPIVLKAGNALVINLQHDKPYYKRFGVRLVPAEDAPPAWPKTPDELVRYTMRGGISNEVDGTPAIYRNVAVGRYVAFCLAGSRYVAARQDIDYQGGFLEVDMPLPQPARDDHIVVRVLGDDGRPIEDATVSIGAPGGWGDDGVVIERGGEYWVYRVPSRHLFGFVAEEIAEYAVTVTHTTLGRRIVAAPLDARDLEVRLGEPATLVVHLDNLPEDRGALRCAAFPRGANEYEELNPRSPGMTNTVKAIQPRNEFKLYPGPVVVLLRARVGDSSIDIHRQELVLGPGETELRVSLPSLSSLSVRVPARVTGYLRLEGRGSGYLLEIANDGTVKYTNVPPGDYRLTHEWGEMKVMVPFTGEVAFVAQPYNALRVVRRDSGGVMQQAGLEIGDVVREVNGVVLTGGATDVRRRAQSAAQGLEKLPLRVQRAGVWRDVSVDAARWQSMDDHWFAVFRTD